MSDTDELDDIFDDDFPVEAKAAQEPAPKPEPEPTPEPEPEAKTADEEDADTGDKNADAPPAPQEKSKPQMVPLAALDDERSKRREHEDRVRNLEAEIAAFKVAQNQRPEPQKQPEAPDPWEDPDAAIKYAVGQANQQFAQRMAAQSEALARERYDDYDQVIAVLGEAAKADPALSQRIWSDPAPGFAAYKEAKRFQAAQEIGDPVTFKQQLEGQIAELRAELESAREQHAAPSLPQSMAGGANVGNRSGPKWNGPMAVEDHFED